MRLFNSTKSLSVSVVIPSYGRPDKLRSCLLALRQQNFDEPWEVVIVDDGSPIPVSKQILDFEVDESSAYPHIHIIRQRNAGPAVARNRGVQEATGDLIAFIDDDCIANFDWLSLLVSSWRRRPNSLIGGSTVNGLKTSVFAAASQTIVNLVYEYFNANSSSAFFLASNNILCSKLQFLEVDGFCRDFPRAGAEDRDFCDRWRTKQWPIIWEKNAVISHYHHQNLAKYIGLHIRYGRGAYIYQKKRKLRRSGSIVQDIGFHQSLPRLLKAHASLHQWSMSEWIRTTLALIIWQAANSLGFAIELLNSKCAFLRTRRGEF
jgi:glycosyltransferase involved in cell wall biosynthesis